ncbi:DUF6461 domain-containing protein [Umezawaea tangerina]|uniref:Uncharacterized protein n=1 Tax=Umezawaea tangerina TaxID=84725 RepID=A0A2T0SE32_9PSEU|nr:DUF6461 domain-containing protein [Umezawaea tangerina]PRY31651.1 hypothetical protein CLV43_12257 [Umezawaea tangerina]
MSGESRDNGLSPDDDCPVSAIPDAWIDEGLGMEGVYCVTLIKDVTPDEALRRFGARDITTATWPELLERANVEEADLDDHVVAAFALGPHVLLVEDNGREGVRRPDLSAGTFAVSSYRSVNAQADFVVSRDGVVLARLDGTATGADLGVLKTALAEMGVHDPGAFEADGDLELLCRLTGVRPTVADMTGSARVAIVRG